MLSDHQLKIAALYNIPLGNVKKLVPVFFDKEKYVIRYENLQLCLRLELKLKNIHRVLEFNQSQWLKQYVEFNTQKRIEVGENGDKDGKVLYKLITMLYREKQRKTCKQQKILLKMDIQTKLYVT